MAEDQWAELRARARKGGRTCLLKYGREHFRRMRSLSEITQAANRLPKMRTYDIALTPDLVAFLARVQAQTGQSRAALIRQALVWWRAEQWGEDE